MRPLCAALGCMALGASATSALAQQVQPTDGSGTSESEERAPQEVIITGTRSAKAVDKIPGAITVISPQEVERTLSLTEDATAVLARTVPGYSESSQAMNTIGETLRGRNPCVCSTASPRARRCGMEAATARSPTWRRWAASK